jgi:hypothetical protein
MNLLSEKVYWNFPYQTTRTPQGHLSVLSVAPTAPLTAFNPISELVESQESPSSLLSHRL